MLESESGILRVPWFFHNSNPNWHRSFWQLAPTIIGRFSLHSGGVVPVGVSPATYLVTNGRYVLTYGLTFPLASGREEEISPGVYTIVTEARLPLGTPAGRYQVKVLEASEVLLLDGTLIRPRVENHGEVIVEDEVVVGWDEGVPPLRFDRASRRVLGKVEFRLANGDGLPTEPGEPVVEGLPGEEVAVRVQMRTEVPLNYIHFELNWPVGKLVCSGSSLPLLSNPEDGQLFLTEWPFHHIRTLCFGSEGTHPGRCQCRPHATALSFQEDR